jgi:hypothetical protein
LAAAEPLSPPPTALAVSGSAEFLASNFDSVPTKEQTLHEYGKRALYAGTLTTESGCLLTA